MNILSIGCFYNFDKSVIVNSELKNNKLYLHGSEYKKVSINEIIDLLCVYPKSKIYINNHTFLNQYFSDKLNQIDFENESLVSQVNDYYKSLLKDDLVIFENIDPSKSFDLKAMFLALSGVKIKLLYRKNTINQTCTGGKIGMSW